MTYNTSVINHYQHGDLLNEIASGLTALGKTQDSLTIDDLAPVDEFHIGGQAATKHLLHSLPFNKKSRLLDIGCGLGGTARYIASHFNSHITGIDLSDEYIKTGNVLCQWVKLNHLITLQQGSALSLPFEDNSFNGAYMLHVGMNIPDKQQLFNEIYRVLSPNSYFGIYDIMSCSKTKEQTTNANLRYPVPWATHQLTSKLETPEYYQHALSQAGFTMQSINHRQDFALAFFQAQQLKNENKTPTPKQALNLHTLMQASAPIKLKNMITNLKNGLISPVEIIIKKP